MLILTLSSQALQDPPLDKQLGVHIAHVVAAREGPASEVLAEQLGVPRVSWQLLVHYSLLQAARSELVATCVNLRPTCLLSSTGPGAAAVVVRGAILQPCGAPAAPRPHGWTGPGAAGPHPRRAGGGAGALGPGREWHISWRLTGVAFEPCTLSDNQLCCCSVARHRLRGRFWMAGL